MIGKTYISAAHCTVCGKYSKPQFDGGTGYRAPLPCNCGGATKLTSVEKGSENDPNVVFDKCNVDGMMIENHRYSRTLSVSASQIHEARARLPGVEFKRFGKYYRPLIRNRAEKLKIMKMAKMEEYPSNHFKERG